MRKFTLPGLPVLCLLVLPLIAASEEPPVRWFFSRGGFTVKAETLLRQEDTADLSRMLGLASDEDLSRVRAAVDRYARDEMDDLESLIYLGRLEMQGG